MTDHNADFTTALDALVAADTHRITAGRAVERARAAAVAAVTERLAAAERERDEALASVAHIAEQASVAIETHIRERDEARSALARGRVAVHSLELDAVRAERDEARAALASAEHVLADAETERDMHAAHLATEPARIAAAETARDVAWVRAACAGEVTSARFMIAAGLGVPASHAHELFVMSTDVDDDITDATIAAAIRAAKGE